MTDTPAPAPEIPEEINRTAERIAAETREKFAGMIHALDARGDELSKRAATAIENMSDESIALVKLRDVLEFDLVHIRKDRDALLARVEELEALLEPFSRAADELCSEGAHDEPNEEVTVERHVHPYSREDIPLQAFVAARGAVAPRYSEEEIQWHAECKRRAGEYMAKVMHSVKLPPPEDSA